MDKQSPTYNRFAIIHHRNSPNSAVTLDGKEVRREDKLWYSETDDKGYILTGRYIMCAPYDDHFIYADPMFHQIIGRWKYMCTCGSPAVIVGYDVYKDMASYATEGSIKGEMLICKYHFENGVHQTGGRPWE